MCYIDLEVRTKNSGAQAFYRQLGYQAVKSLPGYYAGRETAVCMRHDLRLRRPDIGLE